MRKETKPRHAAARPRSGSGRTGASAAAHGREERLAREPPTRHGRTDDGNAFIPDPEGGPAHVSDDLAESLAEEFLESATSGEDVAEEMQDEIVPEELGGPFIETSAEQEFAAGTDASNPEDAEPEPLPRSGAGIVRNPER